MLLGCKEGRMSTLSHGDLTESTQYEEREKPICLVDPLARFVAVLLDKS